MKSLFWLSLSLTVALALVFLQLDPALRGPLSPWGTVSLELCAYTANCDAMVAAWNSHSREIAAFLLGGDYLFMVCYALTLYAGLQLLAARRHGRLQGLARRLSWLAPVAAALDAVENAFLTTGLLQGSYAGLAWPASLAASLKFLLLAITLIGLLTIALIPARPAH